MENLPTAVVAVGAMSNMLLFAELSLVMEGHELGIRATLAVMYLSMYDRCRGEAVGDMETRNKEQGRGWDVGC